MKNLLGLIALVLFVLTSGCASQGTTGERLDDASITATVKGKLAADPEINPFNIDVDTRQGVVRLSGTVDDDATRDEAVRLAEGSRGVVRVENDIRVGEKTVGESLDDAALLAKVKARLAADPEVNPFVIDVDVEGGVVTLSGEVRTAAQRAEAARLAAGTEGVVKVSNRLEVKE